MKITADNVVGTAKDWLATPYLHQGRSRAGVDCAGLVICVGRDLDQLDESFDVTGYTRQPDGTMFDHCETRLVAAPAQPGGIFVMRFNEEPQHMGFFVPYRNDGLAIVHAIARNKCVVEHRLDFIWTRRIVKTYIFAGMVP